MMKRDPRLFNRWIAFIVLLDAVLILFPPIYWAMASGTMFIALTYVVGVPTVVAISVPVLDGLTRKAAQVHNENNHGAGAL
jgi:hypothetical protein